MSTSMPDQLKELRHLWWLFVLFGVLTLGAGIVVLVWPDISLATLAVVVGIFLLVDGVFDVIGSITGEGEQGRGLLALLGALSIIAGLVMVKKPFETLTVFVIILGAWFVVAGVVRFVSAFASDEGRGTLIAVGILDVVAGIVVLSWPELGIATMAVIAGIVLIIRGLAFVYGGWQIRKLPEDGGPSFAAA